MDEEESGGGGGRCGIYLLNVISIELCDFFEIV